MKIPYLNFSGLSHLQFILFNHLGQHPRTGHMPLVTTSVSFPLALPVSSDSHLSPFQQSYNSSWLPSTQQLHSPLATHPSAYKTCPLVMLALLAPSLPSQLLHQVWILSRLNWLKLLTLFSRFTVDYITQGVFKSPESGSHPEPIVLESPVNRTQVFKYFQASPSSALPEDCYFGTRTAPESY